MSCQSREVRDLLERLEGRLSRAVLRGLRGSNAHSATRLLEKWNRTCAYCVTPVKGHHLSGEQSPTFYGNESMLNVSLAPERRVRTIV
jgi:hypothetical protein